MSEDSQKKAAELGFDLTKQFLTLAFAGIAFVVGLSFSSPDAVSSVMLWLIIATFALSAAVGLGFLMHGVNLLSVQDTYDIYASSLRFLAIVQIALVLLGVIFLIPVVNRRPTKKANLASGSMEIRSDGQHAITYNIDPDKTVTIEIEGGKTKVTTVRK